MMYDQRPQPFNECGLKGKGRKPYDICSTKSIEETIKSYQFLKLQHIGSSYVTYHNGVRNQWKELHHFFIKI